MAHLGDKLKEFREEKGWTQPEMADYLTIGYRTYQTIEKKGDIKLVSDLIKIMKVLGMDTFLRTRTMARQRRLLARVISWRRCESIQAKQIFL
jgi:transcriptional regulator with XRE-family HTH domain